LVDAFEDLLREETREVVDRLVELREPRRAPELDPEREREDVGVRVAMGRE